MFGSIAWSRGRRRPKRATEMHRITSAFCERTCVCGDDGVGNVRTTTHQRMQAREVYARARAVTGQNPGRQYSHHYLSARAPVQPGVRGDLTLSVRTRTNTSLLSIAHVCAAKHAHTLADMV